MILFVSHDAQRTGAPIVLLHILLWLRQNTNLDFEIIFRNGGELIEEFKKIAPTHIVRNNLLIKITKKFKIRLPQNYFIPRKIKNKKYDLIYSNTITNGFLISILKKNTRKVITHVHEMDSWIERSGLTNWNHVYAQTDHFIAVSETVKNGLVKLGVDIDKITIIPGCSYSSSENTAVARKEIKRALGIPDDAFVVGGGGAEIWRKGRDIFVQLAIGLHREKNIKNCHFIWLGADSDRESKMWLEIDARHAGCEQKIHWVGSVNNPQDYISSFDIFAMTSREDPMPLIAIEAGMHGLPIVCFQSAGGTAEWVQDICGDSVPYLDVAAMIKSIKNLYLDPSMRNLKGIKAKEITSDLNSINNVSLKILSLIDNELSEKF